VFEHKPSDGWFRALFEAAPNGVMAVDSDGRITLLNAQAEKMFGYGRRELIGKPVDILVPQRFRDGHADLRKRATANPRIRPMGTDRVFFAVRKDGSEFPVEVGLNFMLMSTGQVIVVTVVDVSKRTSRGQRLWHVKTIAAVVLLLSFVIAVALTPLARGLPSKILAFGKKHPAEDVEAAYTAYRKGYYAVALQLARPIAERGDSGAQSLLGLIYLNGNGAQRNESEAIKWYRRAADQGNADAQLRIGDIYFHGLGVPQDYSEARRWYRLAADHGNAFAMYNLGVLYASGEGVPPDNILAHMWFNIAAAHLTTPGSRDRAIASRDAIAKKLSPDEIAKAQELARNWNAGNAGQ
jgi:PAS domain S-box-containing protein